MSGRGVHLKISHLRGSREGTVERFHQSRLGLGRDASNELRFAPGEDVVSSFHARIEHLEGAYWLVDEGSTNGTTVNGKRVERRRLANGDVVELGPGGPQLLVNLELEGADQPVAAAPPVGLTQRVGVLVQESTRKNRRYLYGALGLIVVLGVAMAYLAWVGSAEIARRDEESARAGEQITSLRQSLESSEAQVAELGELNEQMRVELQQQFDALLVTMEASQRQIVELEAEAIAAREEVETLRSSKAALEEQLAETSRRLGLLQREQAQLTEDQEREIAQLQADLTQWQSQVQDLEGRLEQGSSVTSVLDQQAAEARSRHQQILSEFDDVKQRIQGVEDSTGLQILSSASARQYEGLSGQPSGGVAPSGLPPSLPMPGSSATQPAADPQLIRVVSARGSSESPTHPATNAIDGNSATYWQSMTAGPGWLELTLPSEMELSRVEMFTGNLERFQDSPRVRTVSFVFSDGSRQEFAFADTAQLQACGLTPVRSSSVRVEMRDTFPGSLGAELVVPEVRVWGR